MTELDQLLAAWASTQRMAADTAEHIRTEIIETLPPGWWTDFSNRITDTIVRSSRMPNVMQFLPAA
jgi:hypothetical protein